MGRPKDPNSIRRPRMESAWTVDRRAAPLRPRPPAGSPSAESFPAGIRIQALNTNRFEGFDDEVRVRSDRGVEPGQAGLEFGFIRPAIDGGP